MNSPSSGPQPDEDTDGGPGLWLRLVPVGYGIGLTSFATIAAPLLAGFSLTTIVALSSSADNRGTRGDIAIVAFSATTTLMLFALQAGIAASQRDIPPDQRAAQYPEARHSPLWMEKLRADQWRDQKLALQLYARCRWTYNLGIIEPGTVCQVGHLIAKGQDRSVEGTISILASGICHVYSRIRIAGLLVDRAGKAACRLGRWLPSGHPGRRSSTAARRWHPDPLRPLIAVSPTGPLLGHCGRHHRWCGRIFRAIRRTSGSPSGTTVAPFIPASLLASRLVARCFFCNDECFRICPVAPHAGSTTSKPVLATRT